MELIHSLYRPAGAGPFPTILTLHGRGANAFDLLGLAPYICSGRFMMICPQGPLAMPTGPGSTGYAWYPMSMGGSPDVEAILAARKSLENFLEACLRAYPVDAKKLALTGFSQGGVMAYSLGLTNPEKFSGLAVLSSWLPQELLSRLTLGATLPSLPVLVQHGTSDSTIEIERARNSAETLRQMRVGLTYREYPMGHEINGNSLADLSAWLEKKLGAADRP